MEAPRNCVACLLVPCNSIVYDGSVHDLAGHLVFGRVREFLLAETIGKDSLARISDTAAHYYTLLYGDSAFILGSIFSKASHPSAIASNTELAEKWYGMDQCRSQIPKLHYLYFY